MSLGAKNAILLTHATMGHPRLTLRSSSVSLHFSRFFCMYIHRHTHTPFARICAHLHNHLLAHTYAYTRHFTGDHTSCKYACIFKFTRVICVLICKLDHSTTSLPKNRLYSLFSFRFKSFPVKRFYRARSSDRTRDNRARFSLVVVNL